VGNLVRSRAGHSPSPRRLGAERAHGAPAPG